MDSYAFDDIFDTDIQPRSSRKKPEKRKWREIEALKDRQRLRRELADIDMFKDLSNEDLDF